MGPFTLMKMLGGPLSLVIAWFALVLLMFVAAAVQLRLSFRKALPSARAVGTAGVTTDGVACVLEPGFGLVFVPPAPRREGGVGLIYLPDALIEVGKNNDDAARKESSGRRPLRVTPPPPYWTR